MQYKALWHAILIIVAMGGSSALAAPACPFTSAAHAEAKPNKLYLFFPQETVPTFIDPAAFPMHGFDPTASWLPLPKFDTSGLRTYSGTAAQLRDAVHDVVTDIYCELDVQVITTLIPPAPTAPRRNIIGIGVDAIPDLPCEQHLFGESTTAGGDPGDSKAVDFARIWAGYFNCTNLDLGLTGWANSIGGTARPHCRR